MIYSKTLLRKSELIFFVMLFLSINMSASDKDYIKSIIEDIIRKDNNKKKGTQEITKWFTKA